MPRKEGEKVGVDHAKYPGVWVVKKVNPVNVVLEPEGGGRPLRCHPSLLTEPPKPGAVVTGRSGSTAVPVAEYYNPGELIRITSGRYAGLYVVIADKGGDKVNLAKLGGDGGRYLRAIRVGLVKVDPADVLKD